MSSFLTGVVSLKAWSRRRFAGSKGSSAAGRGSDGTACGVGVELLVRSNASGFSMDKFSLGSVTTCSEGLSLMCLSFVQFS